MVWGITESVFDGLALSSAKVLFWFGWTVCGSRSWERDRGYFALQRNSKRFQSLFQADRRRCSKWWFWNQTFCCVHILPLENRCLDRLLMQIIYNCKNKENRIFIRYYDNGIMILGLQYNMSSYVAVHNLYNSIYCWSFFYQIN